MSLKFQFADRESKHRKATEKSYREVVGSMVGLMIRMHASIELINDTLKKSLLPGERARLESYKNKLTKSVEDVKDMKTNIENHKEELTQEGDFSDYFTAAEVGMKQEIDNREKFVMDVNKVVYSYRNKGTVRNTVRNTVMGTGLGSRKAFMKYRKKSARNRKRTRTK